MEGQTLGPQAVDGCVAPSSTHSSGLVLHSMCRGVVVLPRVSLGPFSVVTSEIIYNW